LPTSPEGTILVHRLWKRFRADRGRRLLRDELERLRARSRGDDSRAWRWALRDVSFRAPPGESLGLVGVNGSGKTTLLKMLARVMYPYAGRLDVSGRVGALIEVRAGIHPDLTGRENVYLYGSLLGLRRRETAPRFDEIVAFAELENAIDRQVKFYSSGMQMRLGFAVAAFLEPDILLVDEVLAVGDAAFQQKCLDRMRAVLAQGTTLIFVSHDLPAVEATCSRGIWLREGLVAADGPVRDVLGDYRRSIEEAAESVAASSDTVRVLKADVTGAEGGPSETQGPLEIRAIVSSPGGQESTMYLGVTEGTAEPIFVVSRKVDLPAGETEAQCLIRHLPLPAGRFYLWMGIVDGDGRDLLGWHPAARFDVTGPDLDGAPRGIVRAAPIAVDADWELTRR
jgi:ABC-2 type transport system ATP-binding protein